MNETVPTAFIVDDDEAVVDSLTLLLDSVGIKSEGYASAHEFLEAYDPQKPGCLLLDLRLPGMSGMELQQRLHDMRSILPIVFITGHGTVESAVHAMRAGAVEFLQKPFREEELIQVVQKAISADTEARCVWNQHEELRGRLESLTPRERQVMEHVVAGEPNKVIAIDLSISERTVEVHRARAMSKMKAGSLPELVRMVLALKEDAREGSSG